MLNLLSGKPPCFTTSSRRKPLCVINRVRRHHWYCRGYVLLDATGALNKCRGALWKNVTEGLMKDIIRNVDECCEGGHHLVKAGGNYITLCRYHQRRR